MTSFDETTATDLVLARIEGCPDPRLKAIMTSVVRHLHAVVREVEPSMDEWLAAIRFLTVTGQISDERRQEWILLSDTLGVSMLVDAMVNRTAAAATPSTVLGPFHVEGAPARAMGDSIALDAKGEPCLVEGSVLDAAGRPVAGAWLDVWQASADGFYDTQQPGLQPEMNLRGRFRTGANGRWSFRTVKPASYAIPTDGPVGRMLAALGRHAFRPAHIHFIVTAPGFRGVTTHIFVEGDPYLRSDAVFGVKDALIVPFRRQGDIWRAAYDFRLEAA